jgi:hypothetical protein
MKKINDIIAIKITELVGTMGCVYIFFIWSMLPVFFHNSQALVFYVSGAVLQLVLLPLIMVGQKLLGAESEQRAKEDHINILNEFEELKQMHLDTQEAILGLKRIEILVNEFITINRKA